MRLKSKHHFLKPVLWILCILLIGGGVYLSPFGQQVKNGFLWVKDACINRAHWTLRQAMVVGNRRTDKETILSALKIEQYQNMSDLNLNEMREKLLDLPWVKDVVIERYIPDTLQIRIMEKTPVALWQNQGVYWPLDETGTPIKDNKLLPADLIVVVGSDAPENTLELLETLEQVPDINRQVKAASRVENRRWNLRLNDLDIYLPQKNMLQALKRLEQKDRQEKLLKKEVTAIDIRLDDRIILHPKKTTKGKKKK